MGRLYTVDMRLRPTGESGSLVVTLAEFDATTREVALQTWERQALTKARAVVVGPAVSNRGRDRGPPGGIREPGATRRWPPRFGPCAAGRGRASPHLNAVMAGSSMSNSLSNYCKCDAAGRPELQGSNTPEALARVHAAGLMTDHEYEAFHEGYDFLRLAESRLRGVTNRATDDLPDEPAALAKLARRLGYDSAEPFLVDLARQTRRVRAAFELVCGRERGEA